MTAKLTEAGRAMFKAHPNSDACLRAHEALLERIAFADQHAHESGFVLGAYSLVPYIAPSGAFEYVWNSLNRTPRTNITLSATGEAATAIKVPIFAPDWVPAVGDQVMVDLTEVRARIIVRENLDKHRLDSTPQWANFEAACKQGGLTFEEGLEINVRNTLARSPTDVIHVTSGFIEQLQRDRADGLALSVHLLEAFNGFLDHLVEIGRLRYETARIISRDAHGARLDEREHIVFYDPRDEEDDAPLPSNGSLVALDSDRPLALKVRAYVKLHAKFNNHPIVDGYAVTRSPSTPGVETLAISTWWDGEVALITAQDGEARIGAQIMVGSVHGPWAEHRWSGGIPFASRADALAYHNDLTTRISAAFDVKVYHPDIAEVISDARKIADEMRRRSS